MLCVTGSVEALDVSHFAAVSWNLYETISITLTSLTHSCNLHAGMAWEDEPADRFIEGSMSATLRSARRGNLLSAAAVLYDQGTVARVASMRCLHRAWPVEVYNFPLNEADVFGFEYGYSAAVCKRTLVP